MDQYFIKPDDQGRFCIVDRKNNNATIGRVRSFGAATSYHISENIAALLNYRTPPHEIPVDGQPRYFRTDQAVKGFEVRDGLGDTHRVFTFTLSSPDYNHLMDHFTPNFFSALCDKMAYKADNPKPKPPPRRPNPT